MSGRRGWQGLARWARGTGLRRARTLLVPAALALAACNGGGSVNIANSQAVDPATVDYPIFYVKRTVPTNTDGTLVQDDLRIVSNALPSADLYMRASAAVSAAETNVTARITAAAAAAGQFWDVKDGPVDTRMIHSLEAQLNPADPASVGRRYQSAIPMGRYVAPEEIANTGLFLCSDLAAAITGAQYVVDGGRTATGGAVTQAIQS